MGHREGDLGPALLKSERHRLGEDSTVPVQAAQRLAQRSAEADHVSDETHWTQAERRACLDAEPAVGGVLRDGLPEGDFGGHRDARIGVAEVGVRDAGRVHEALAPHTRTDADGDEAADGPSLGRPRACGARRGRGAARRRLTARRSSGLSSRRSRLSHHRDPRAGWAERVTVERSRQAAYQPRQMDRTPGQCRIHSRRRADCRQAGSSRSNRMEPSIRWSIRASTVAAMAGSSTTSISSDSQ